MKTVFRLLRSLFYLLLVGAALAGIGLFILVFVAVQDLPQVPDPLSRIIETPPTEIYAASGERILVVGGRETIPLNRVSPYFVKAVIATEDHRFWEHHGIDKLRTLKALWITLFEPGQIQGASTITQQLAKNLFFSFERTYKRKFRELLVALQIELQYTKAEILEAYINQIPFGVGAFGIESAARLFFGKTAAELSISESALLAGLPKSPTRYNPFRHLERARERQQLVLKRMQAVGYITAAEAAEAMAAEIRLRSAVAGPRTGSYFLDWIMDQLELRYGPQIVYHGGLRVTTTLDPKLQSVAVASLRTGLQRVDQEMGLLPDAAGSIRPQGALAAVEVHSGAVKALVGGRSYFETEYNRAVQNNRQPGSGFKPFLYYAAFEKLGWHPATVVEDRPVRIPVVGAPDWRPENFSRRFRGPVILKSALLHSINTAAARLVEQTGPAAVVETAKRCGITSPLKPVFSLAMGTSGVSPLEMASAFATFAAAGMRHQPFGIWRVEDARGRILEEHVVSGKRTLDAAIAYQIIDLMKAVVDRGTGAVIRRRGFEPPAAGKTGTTNNFVDAWFTGMTPTLSASVWVGHDHNEPLRDLHGVGMTGGRCAAPIWADFMQQALAGEPHREFVIPPGIHFIRVDPQTGAPAEDGMRVAMRKGQQPAPPETDGAGSYNPDTEGL